MRLPCIMRWPKGIKPGRVSDQLFSAIDFLPTLVRFAGGKADQERKIDGLDCSGFLLGKSRQTPRKDFYYYFCEMLTAVRSGKWKLVTYLPEAKVDPVGTRTTLLYDLSKDPGETIDVAGQNPAVVRRLERLLASCRKELGDSSMGIRGSGCRASGRVRNPKPLTTFDPDHPYMIAAYDGAAG
jgi:arylsulfatase A